MDAQSNSESPFFERTCQLLEQTTALSQLQARGTIRLALKEAGFDSRSVNRPQMLATVLQSLPAELSRVGVEDSEGVCEQIIAGLASVGTDSKGADVE